MRKLAHGLEMTCGHCSVHNWLWILRFTTEDYDPLFARFAENTRSPREKTCEDGRSNNGGADAISKTPFGKAEIALQQTTLEETTRELETKTVSAAVDKEGVARDDCTEKKLESESSGNLYVVASDEEYIAPSQQIISMEKDSLPRYGIGTALDAEEADSVTEAKAKAESDVKEEHERSVTETNQEEESENVAVCANTNKENVIPSTPTDEDNEKEKITSDSESLGENRMLLKSCDLKELDTDDVTNSEFKSRNSTVVEQTGEEMYTEAIYENLDGVNAETTVVLGKTNADQIGAADAAPTLIGKQCDECELPENRAFAEGSHQDQFIDMGSEPIYENIGFLQMHSRMAQEFEDASSYEGIWDCTTDIDDESALKFGRVCRISVDFDESVNELCLTPVVVTKFDFNIPSSILQWQTELLYDYSSEEDESQEYASLEKINEQRGTVNQTQPFPIDNAVEIRHNSESVRRHSYRSQTVHEFAHGSLEQQLEPLVEIQIDVRGVAKILCNRSTRKLSKGQFLRICHDRVYLWGDKGEEELLIDQLNHTQYKPVSKKELVITRTIDDECRMCKLQFDSTKEMNVAIVDLERYYGGDRPIHHLQVSEEKSQIRYKLLKLLGKRSSKDLLEKKGIIRNEPIFGNTLRHLYEKHKHEVPEFVTRIMQLIELPWNIKSLGLYRASGNLATIQKIRFHIDKNNVKILDEFRNDIDVLTGSLKLFFRELKEPLIPHKSYEELCRYLDTDVSTKTDHIKNIVNKMEKPHRKTLTALLEHLLKVEAHSEENRMDAYNISIVWGPTLIWPPDSSHENILLNHTNANKVIELLLHCYKRPHAHEPARKEVEDLHERVTSRSALMLELNENLTHSIHANSRDNISKSTDSLKSQDSCSKTPEREARLSLEALCSHSKDRIPEFATKVIPLIEKRIDTELLYKYAGNNDKIEKIRKKVCKTRSNLSSMEKYNVHDLASGLKSFFADLSEPLIPKEVFERLVLATDERIEMTKLRNTKKELVKANIPYKETLDYLFKHLVKVSLHEEANKMSKHNIAMAWAPCLGRCYMENNEISLGACVQVIETLLQIYDTKTVINVGTERDFKNNMDVFNIYYKNDTARTAVKSEENHQSTEKDKFAHNPALKRSPNVHKNNSSLYRVSRYISNTFSVYDNVQPGTDKNEAIILEEDSKGRQTGERRTKL